jgi:hypothetical protein
VTQHVRYAPFAGPPVRGPAAECPSRGPETHAARRPAARAAPWTAAACWCCIAQAQPSAAHTFALPFGRKFYLLSPQDGRIQDNKTRFERLPPAPAPRPRLASSGVEPRELDATRRAPVPPSPLTARTHAASLRRRTTITATHTAHRNDAAYLSVFSSLLPLIPVRHEVGPDKYVEGCVPGNAERGLCCSSIDSCRISGSLWCSHRLRLGGRGGGGGGRGGPSSLQFPPGLAHFSTWCGGVCSSRGATWRGRNGLG